MLVYGLSFYTSKFADLGGIWALVLAATLAAFLGSFLGTRLIKKITLHTVQIIVGIMLLLIGFGMAIGLL
jgi:uncharacterized membrane protein YfcA